MTTPVYDSINVVITLRCNGGCKNCIRLCCSERTTGLDYYDLDMTGSEFVLVLQDLMDLSRRAGRPAVGILCITGGEPLLHPAFNDFMTTAIRYEGQICDQVAVNTNATLPINEAFAPRILHWWAVGEEKAQNHVAMLVDPAERGEMMTYADCTHFRKDRIVVTSQGYSRCCAGEGYMRLFGAQDLVIPHLPDSIDDWPNQDRICAHCAFAAPTQIMERDVGSPMSAVFESEAAKNKAGRRIRSRLSQRIYPFEFFEREAVTAGTGAAAILPLVFAKYAHGSVLDVGCGTGAWCETALQLGASKATGVDGPWAKVPEQRAWQFIATDLERPLSKSLFGADLAICMDVAEHLAPHRGPGLIADLTRLAPVVLWSAATPGQTGEGHVNEKPEEYWAGLFAACGFELDDCVRSVIANTQVPEWYKRHAVVYRKV